VPIPFPSDQAFFESLVKYQSTKNLERWFCRECGASVCNYDRSDGEWEFATGVIDMIGFEGESREGKGFLDGKLHRAYLWVSDTIDGGGVVWLNEGKVEGLAGRHPKGREGLVTDEMLREMEEKGKTLRNIERAKALRFRCHCGDVEFEVTAPENGMKYAAGLCACTSCRKTCGFEITSWATIPKPKIGLGLEKPSLGRYSSSEGVQRYFCKRCSATIIYARDGLDNADVAVGIMDSEMGARAEAWLDWNRVGGDVSYEEDAVDEDFAKKLAAGYRAKISHS
jgi:hypothetical protein